MSSKLIPGTNDLATLRPNLLSEWNYDKNEIGPNQILAQSNKMMWWKCSLGHEWQAKVSNRFKGKNCPYCAGKKVLKGFNDIATTDPQIASEWNYEKNGDITPFDVSSGMGKSFWWKCKNGHEWQAPPYNRIRKDGYSGCPFCRKELRTSFPEQAIYFYIKQQCPDAVNSDCDAIGMELDIYIPSIKTAIEYDGLAWHTHKSAINSEKKKNKLCKEKNIFLIRIREDGSDYPDCAYCIKWKSRFSNDELSALIKLLFQSLKLKTSNIDVTKDESNIYDQYIVRTKESSLAALYPQIAQEWHPTKNGKLKPENVSAHSGKKVWWQCSLGHEYHVTVNDRTGSKNINCPYCSNHKVLKGFNDLKSLAPKIASEWNYKKNAPLLPEDVVIGSQKKVWWQCDKDHEWAATVYSRTKYHTGCPICSNRLLVRGINDLFTVNPELSLEWNQEKNGNTTPHDVVAGGGKLYWWRCSKCGHEWKTSIGSRINGSGCTMCAIKIRTDNRSENLHNKGNTLANMRPDIAAEWHPTKNEELTPDMVTYRNGKKVWWKCSVCGYEWKTSVKHRTEGTGCPQCANTQNANRKKRKIINLDTNEIFDDLRSAAQCYNVSESALSQCLRGTTKTSAKYHWKYKDE